MTNKYILTGSQYFFTGMPDFKPHDIDYIYLSDNADSIISHSLAKDDNGNTIGDIFTWKKMTASEYVRFINDTASSFNSVSFLIPEFVQQINFTINDLKSIAWVINLLHGKRACYSYIANAYIANNDFYLTEQQKAEAYKIYKEAKEQYCLSK